MMSMLTFANIRTEMERLSQISSLLPGGKLIFENKLKYELRKIRRMAVNADIFLVSGCNRNGCRLQLFANGCNRKSERSKTMFQNQRIQEREMIP